MSVNSTDAFSGPYVATGAAQQFPFTFNAASRDEIQVTADGITVDPTTYSVTLNSDGTGAVNATLPAGVEVFVESNPDFSQTAQFARFAPYFPDALNGPLDRSAIRDIALRDRLDRTFVIPRRYQDAAGKFARISDSGQWELVDGVPGLAGPAAAYRVNLAALKAAATTDGQSTYDGSLWLWTLGNFSGQADDVNVVKAATVALTVGAWVRQKGDAIAFTASGANARTRNLADKARETVSAPDFWLPTDPDDSNSLTRALATGKKVFLPAAKGHGTGGDYLVQTVVLPTNAYIYGEGSATKVRLPAGNYSNIFYVRSPSASTFVDNITLRDMDLYGRIVEDGFSEQKHIARLSGVRRLTVDSVGFFGFAGDGLYLGSGDTPTDERHNFDITVRNCTFDGVNKNNRNAISVIDGIGGVIDGCTFRRCSRVGMQGWPGTAYDTFNPAAGPGMPGPIDFEPDNAPYHRISDWTVSNNTFDQNSGNLGQVCFFIPVLVPMPARLRVVGNKFTNYTGIGADISIDCNRTITDSDYRTDLLIDGNQGVGGTRPFDLYAVRGVTVTRSNSWQDYLDSSLIGFTGVDDRAWDIKIDGDYRLIGRIATGLRIFQFTNLTLSGTFDSCAPDTSTGYPIQFGGTSSSNATLKDLTIIPRPNQTIGINSAGHTFSTALNRQMNVRLGSLTSQFLYRAETRAALTFSNGWSDAGGTLIERNSEGRISLNLNLSGGTVVLNTLIAMLPIGYRPTAQVFGVFQSGTAFGGLRFDPDGSVYITPAALPAPSARGCISYATGS